MNIIIHLVDLVEVVVKLSLNSIPTFFNFIIIIFFFLEIYSLALVNTRQTDRQVDLSFQMNLTHTVHFEGI